MSEGEKDPASFSLPKRLSGRGEVTGKSATEEDGRQEKEEEKKSGRRSRRLKVLHLVRCVCVLCAVCVMFAFCLSFQIREKRAARCLPCQKKG